MKRCCGSCKKWRKITGRTGQCEDGENHIVRTATTAEALIGMGSVTAQKKYPITTPLDDYCDHYERRE